MRVEHVPLTARRAQAGVGSELRACDLYNAAALMSLSDANIVDLFIRQLLSAAVCASPPCPLSPPVIVYSNACACDEDGVV